MSNQNLLNTLSLTRDAIIIRPISDWFLIEITKEYVYCFTIMILSFRRSNGQKIEIHLLFEKYLGGGKWKQPLHYYVIFSLVFIICMCWKAADSFSEAWIT